MSLGNLSLELLIVIIGGFLLGAVPAFLLIGIYFGRRIEKEREALRLSYDRQITALRDTVRRLLERIDVLTSQRDELEQTNNTLRAAVLDQHQVTDQASQDLEEAQEDIHRLQEQVATLQAEQYRNEGRLEQANLQQERMAVQLQQTVDQFLQTKRLQQNLMFAATQLRESRVSNEAMEARLRTRLRPLPDEDSVSAERMDVGVIEGLEPVYAERLHESGIHTVGDLARQTPARVAHFAGLSTWDDSAAWIAEAKIRLAAFGGPQA